MSEAVERVARAICAHISGGFRNFGGEEQGCKVGRGQSWDGTNCVATTDQLLICGEWEAARAAIMAMSDVSQAKE